MHPIETHIVTSIEKPIRFQEYGVGIFRTIPTKSALKKYLKKNLIFIDGIPATTSKYISGGEKITLFESEKVTDLKKLKLTLKVLFEDDSIAVVYKPAGIVVSGNKFVTIANALPQNLQKSNSSDTVKPQPVHRLDYATSGLVLIGKTSSAIQKLGKLFENKEITKTYIAVTTGKMCEKGTIHFTIDSKNASTEFEVLSNIKSKRFEYLNLVRLMPTTGRKHQLRKHLAAIGHQILGDKEYGEKRLLLNGKGMYLHALSLQFKHPILKESIFISSEIPKKYQKLFPDFNKKTIMAF